MDILAGQCLDLLWTRSAEKFLIREVIKSPFDEEDKTDGISPRNSYLEDDELQLLDNQMFNLKK